MTYQEAMDYFNTRYAFGSKPGLERIKILTEFLGNPQKDLKYVHIAGTNGKGSTSSFVFHMLKEQGLKVGLFTSPYIQRFSERIKVNDCEISQEDIARIITEIRRLSEMMEEKPTWFEILTAMAFVYFKEKACDIVVLEVGLGGELDSTNIIDCSEASVITTINYDHMEILGNTLEEIASKKAGIIKPGGKVVVYPQQVGVTDVIRNKCLRENATLVLVEESDINLKSYSLNSQIFDYKDLHNLEIRMLGTHQIYNASVALEAVLNLKDTYPISEEKIRQGLYKTFWPGRLEVLSKEPLFLLDGAHNAQGALTLLENIKALCPGKKFTFIVGVLAHKDYESMLKPFLPIAEEFITINPEPEGRGMDAEKLAEYLRGLNAKAREMPGPEVAIDEVMGSKKYICAFGSLYYIGRVRDYFGL